MNVSDVVTRVKRQFGDESEVQLTEADIIRYINDAQREIVMHNETVLTVISTENLVDGTNEYSFPSNLFILRSLRIKPTVAASYESVQHYNLQEFDRRVDGWDGSFWGTGTPCIYTTYNRLIYLFPTPNTDITDGLKILYSRTPTEIVLVTDELSVPLEYHNSIVKYCLMQANILDEDYDAMALHQSNFLADVRTLSHGNSQGNQDVYPTITVLPDDAW